MPADPSILRNRLRKGWKAGGHIGAFRALEKKLAAIPPSGALFVAGKLRYGTGPERRPENRSPLGSIRNAP